MIEPAKRWVLTDSPACKAEMHEYCDIVWCDCHCHEATA